MSKFTALKKALAKGAETAAELGAKAADELPKAAENAGEVATDALPMDEASRLARGEENAFQAHMRMFSPEAQKALATETRGQNSWVNFGPKGAENRTNPANTTYATQKAGILPDWAINEGRYDTQASSIDGKKAAALTGAGIGTAAMLGDSEEAEASTKIIPRPMLEKFLKESTQDGVLNTAKLLELMQIKPLAFTSNLNKTSDLLGHVALERLGLPEDQYMEALKRMYPEVDLIEGGIKSGGLPNPSIYGAYKRPFVTNETGTGIIDNPKAATILYQPELEQLQTSLLSTLLHEGQHLKDSIHFPDVFSTAIPNFKLNEAKILKKVDDDPKRVYEVLSNNPKVLSDLVKVYNSSPRIKNKLDLEVFGDKIFKADGTPVGPNEVIKLLGGDANRAYTYFDNPNLSPEEILQQITGKHHVQYPKNYELEKTKQLVEQGNVNVTDLEYAAKQLKDRENQYKIAEANYLAKRGLQRAAAITAAATGASMLSAEDAEASPRFRKIKRIIDKTGDMTNKGLMASAALAPAAEGLSPQEEAEISKLKREEAEALKKQAEQPAAPKPQKKPSSWQELFNKASNVRKSGTSYDIDNLPTEETGLEPIEAVGEIVDRATAAPARAATLAALEGNNPIEAAKEGFMGKEVEGSQVARKALERAEEAGLPVRTPGSDKYQAEGPLGFAADMGLDFTNLIGVGAGAKAIENAQKFKQIKTLLGR